MHPIRRLLYVLFILLLACNPGAAQSGADTLSCSSVVWFPSLKIFPRMVAGGNSHQFGVSKDLSSSMIHGSIGALIPVLEVSLEAAAFQVGAGATVLTSFIKRPRLLQMVTADFLVEFPVDIRITDRITLRTGYGHFSAHFADTRPCLEDFHPIKIGLKCEKDVLYRRIDSFDCRSVFCPYPFS